jgi:7-cyano-7-deazaguanine synthase in queuosine biosynthesis
MIRENVKVVCMLSGGPDSTAMIWKYLTETEHRVHIHHCILDTTDVNRHNSEWVAVQGIIKWLRNPANAEKYNYSIVGQIEGFTYNRFEFKGFGAPHDHFLYAMMGACFFMAPGEHGAPISWQNHTRAMATGRCAEDGTTTGGGLFNKAKRMFEFATEGNVAWMTPMVGYGKREIINMLPRELFELTTSCSYPKKLNGEWTGCNECVGCARRLEGMYQSDKYSKDELPEWHKYIEKRPNNEVQGYT